MKKVAAFCRFFLAFPELSHIITQYLKARQIKRERKRKRKEEKEKVKERENDKEREMGYRYREKLLLETKRLILR